MHVFSDAGGNGSFASLGLAANSDKKSVIAFGLHTAIGKDGTTRQPYLHNEGGSQKFDAEYRYSAKGVASTEGGQVITTTDGGYAFTVSVLDPRPPDGSLVLLNGHLTKVDASGKPVFDVQFCARDAKQNCMATLPVDLLQDPTTKNYAVLSQVLSGTSYGLFLTFIADNGSVLGSSFYAERDSLVAQEMVPGAGADTYLVVGTRVDAKGAINAFYGEFSRAVAAPRFAYALGGDGVDEQLQSVASTPNGGYALGGWFTDAKAGNEAWLVLLDKDGNLKTQLAYGGPASDTITSVSNAPGSGFAFGGATLTWGAGVSDLWNLRVDSEGAIGFNAALLPKPVSYAPVIAALSIKASVTAPNITAGTTVSVAEAVAATVKIDNAAFTQVSQAP